MTWESESYWEINLLKFSDIIVANASNIHVAHIVPVKIHDFLSFPVDLSSEVVSCPIDNQLRDYLLFLDIAKLIKAVKPVLLVIEFNFTSQLMV